MALHRDHFTQARDQIRMGLDLGVYPDAGPVMVLGEVFIKMWDPVTGEILVDKTLPAFNAPSGENSGS